MRLTPILIVLMLITACDPKPIADLPALDGKKRPDVSDRELPGGKTLAAALSLLDPRVGNVAELDQRRADFEQKLEALVPDKAQRETMGFARVLRWHRLYTRRLNEQKRAYEGHRQRLKEALEPPRKHWLTVDDNGTARLCRKGQVAALVPEHQPTRDKNDTPKAPDEPPPVCKQVPGYAQLGHEVDQFASGLDSLVEAEWYLMNHISRLRAKLDPAAFVASNVPAP